MTNASSGCLITTLAFVPLFAIYNATSLPLPSFTSAGFWTLHPAGPSRFAYLFHSMTVDKRSNIFIAPTINNAPLEQGMQSPPCNKWLMMACSQHLLSLTGLNQHVWVILPCNPSTMEGNTLIWISLTRILTHQRSTFLHLVVQTPQLLLPLACWVPHSHQLWLLYS